MTEEPDDYSLYKVWSSLRGHFQSFAARPKKDGFSRDSALESAAGQGWGAVIFLPLHSHGPSATGPVGPAKLPKRPWTRPLPIMRGRVPNVITQVAWMETRD